MTALFVSLVLATPTFPSVLQQASAAPSTPACAVCHRGASMRGTVTTPLGAALLQRGLAAYDEASLRSAVSMLGSTDSDGDGQGDVAELAAGKDPNTSDAVAAPKPSLEPQYGCSATSSTSGLALALLVCVRSGRRRRGARPR